MWSSYLLGVGLLVGMTVGWVLVQRAWRATFPEAAPGGDALAGRLGCHGCGECTSNCERPGVGETPRAKEVES